MSKSNYKEKLINQPNRDRKNINVKKRDRKNNEIGLQHLTKKLKMDFIF